MKIEEVKISNILSFHNFELKLADKNIIIGTNGTGKSNFADLINNSVQCNYFNDFKSKYPIQYNSKIMLYISLNPDEINDLIDFVLINYFTNIINNPNENQQEIAGKINSDDFKSYRDKIKDKNWFKDLILSLQDNQNNKLQFTNLTGSSFYVNDMDIILQKIGDIIYPDKKIISSCSSNSFNNFFENNYYALKLFKKYISENKYITYNNLYNFNDYVLDKIKNKIKYIENYNGQDCAKDLLELKKKQDILDTRFTTIKDNFKRTMNYDIDVTEKDDGDDKGKPYLYMIVENSKYEDLSKGQKELIYLLTKLYKDDNSIILIDEPVTGLSCQNKYKFREVVLENDNNNMSQYILITHDKDLISEKNCDKIIRFHMDDNNKTVGTSLKNIFL